MKVEIFLKHFGDEIGYDIRVVDPLATVQQYLDALNTFILNEKFSRTRAITSLCEGCEHCCSERIPLTSIDVIRLWQSQPQVGSTIPQILDYFGEVADLGPGYDVTLKRLANNTCKLLNVESGRCTIYQHRPLVCQTFICCPSSLRAQQLRSIIVNLGEDELTRLWSMDRMLAGEQIERPGHMSTGLGFSGQDNGFTGKTKYSEVLIRDLCHPALWQQLSGE